MKLTGRERMAYLILDRLDGEPDGLSATELVVNGYIARDMRDAMVCGGYLRTEPFTGGRNVRGRRYYMTEEGRMRLKRLRRHLARKPPEPDTED